MELRWQPQVLGVLADLRVDSARRSLLTAIADTLYALELELELKSGSGQMWFVPIQGAGNGWVLVCSNDEPGVLVISYLGPAF